MSSIDIRGKVEGLIKDMAAAVRACEMYGDGHKLVAEIIDALVEKLDSVFSEVEEITLGIVGNEIIFEKEPFYNASGYLKGFIKNLKEIKSEKISFSRGVRKKDIVGLIRIIAAKTKHPEVEENFKKTFVINDIQNITVGEIGPLKKNDQLKAIKKTDFAASAGVNYRNGMKVLTEAVKGIEKGHPLDMKAIRGVMNGMLDGFLQNKEALLMLTSTKSYDESTFVHNMNVSVFTLLQAESLGMEQNYLSDIGMAGLLHDVGKLSITSDLIKKQKELTEEERDQICMHPINGAKILLGSPGISLLAAITSFEHHIFYNGSGYPKKVFGNKLNLVSMMISIADCYDALRSRRSYHKETASEETYEEMMKMSGKYFHPDLLNNFFSVVGVYSPGTLVELDNKEIGIVVKESALNMRRPRVEMLYSEKGEKIKDPRIVNLLEKDKNGKYRWTIARSIVPSDNIHPPDKYK